MPTDSTKPSNLPNLRRLFVDARTDAEESEYSRNAVCPLRLASSTRMLIKKFYNLVIFMSSIAGFSLIAQRMMTGKDTTL
jgi:hypothetical protein